jgi:hypothetical protein
VTYYSKSRRSAVTRGQPLAVPEGFLTYEIRGDTNVSGIAGSEDAVTAVGNFYTQFIGDLCAYDLPGGALSMQFIAGAEHITTFDDGADGSILQGTWELTVLDATGIFRHFTGGHNHMLDNLHFLASGDIDEYCVCFIDRHK